jgi:hypothetical protein
LAFGSDNGGKTAAVLFSLVSSCQRHGLDPFRYLEDVLYRLPGWTKDCLAELKPGPASHCNGVHRTGT